MSIVTQAEAPPLREEDDGAIRIGKTRVLLELVIYAFQDGATPETIVQRYSTLQLSDAYSVIAWYLRHREVVDQYLVKREKKGNENQGRAETANQDLSEIRARLQARRST